MMLGLCTGKNNAQKLIGTYYISIPTINCYVSVSFIGVNISSLIKHVSYELNSINYHTEKVNIF